MIKNSGVILLLLVALLLVFGTACAAEETANLSLSKVVTSQAPYKTGQPVTWEITLANAGPANATNISLSEGISGFAGLVSMNGTADLGTYDNTTRIWTISRLDNATSAILTITTVFDEEGTQTNNIDITTLDQANSGTTHAEMAIVVQEEAEETANLSLSKVVTSQAPYKTGQPITWEITLTNAGSVNATNITISEGISGFSGLASMNGTADLGTYDNATRIWTISRLDNATSAILTITTVFDEDGTQTNNVDVTSLDQANSGSTHAEEAIVVQGEAEDTVNLSLSKVVTSHAPYKTGQPVLWKITLVNSGPANATNISLSEGVSGFSGLTSINGTADLGTYNNTTRIWTISQLDNATSAILTITTVFSEEGKQTNNIDITSLDQTNSGTTHADASIAVNNTTVKPPEEKPHPVSGNISIRPTTLNLQSKGVFTVFVTLSSGKSAGKPSFDFEDSSLTCSGAEMIRAGMSNRDGGTLIAKFHRQDLENVTNGTGVKIVCSGTLFVNGEPVEINGSDTITVIGEKKGLDKFVSDVLKRLGLEKDESVDNEPEDGNITVPVTLNTDAFKNYGQMKKAIRNQDSDDEGTTGDGQNVTANKTTQKSSGNDKKVKDKDTGKNNGKGNNGNKDNSQSNGNQDNKKNK